MTLSTVPILLDLVDGTNVPIQSGTAFLAPSYVLTDPTDNIVATQVPIPCPFFPTPPTSTPYPLVKLIANTMTDGSTPLNPTGWAWQITFQGDYLPTPWSFLIDARNSPPFSFTATSANPCVFTAATSAYANGTPVILTGTSLPAGFLANQVYFVVSASGATFQLAATPGGTGLASASAGSGTVQACQYLSSLVTVVSAAQFSAYAPLWGAIFTGFVAPAVVGLTFGPSIPVNNTLGNAFNLTLTASTGTLGNPSAPTDGQVIRFRITQGPGGNFTLAYGSAYDFGAAGPPTLSTAAGKVDIVGFEYVASIGKWCYVGSGLGF